MTDTCDRERLALFVNNDLSAPERLAVEAHVRTCESCGEVLSHYQAGAGALALAYGAELRVARAMPRASPSRRYWKPAVAALLALTCLLLAVQTPVVADTIKHALSLLTVRELDGGTLEAGRAAVRQETERMSAEMRPMAVFPQDHVERAERQAGFDLLIPSYVPEGYEPGSIQMARNEAEPRMVTITYRKGEAAFPIQQYRPGYSVEFDVPAGNLKEVRIGEARGFLVTGTWTVSGDRPADWKPSDRRSLYAEIGGRTVVITDGGWGKLTEEDLVKIAESLE